jgi:hypothetical protein
MACHNAESHYQRTARPLSRSYLQELLLNHRTIPFLEFLFALPIFECGGVCDFFLAVPP